MITDRTKANAIALLKLGDSPTKISEDLELPLMLIREWAEAAGLDTMIDMQANTNALERIINQELIPPTDDNIAMLKTKIEETAIKIVDAVSNQTNGYADLPTAKALSLLANTCTSIYTTIINKGNVAPPGDGSLTMFDHVSKN